MNGRVHDITNVETEHLLSASTYKGRVVLRVEGGPDIHLGHLTAGQARDIATHLLEAAARCEYEQDLWSELTRIGMDEAAIGLVFHAVRAGEMRRHTSVDPEA